LYRRGFLQAMLNLFVFRFVSAMFRCVSHSVWEQGVSSHRGFLGRRFASQSNLDDNFPRRWLCYYWVTYPSALRRLVPVPLRLACLGMRRNRLFLLDFKIDNYSTGRSINIRTLVTTGMLMFAHLILGRAMTGSLKKIPAFEVNVPIEVTAFTWPSKSSQRKGRIC